MLYSVLQNVHGGSPKNKNIIMNFKNVNKTVQKHILTSQTIESK